MNSHEGWYAPRVAEVTAMLDSGSLPHRVLLSEAAQTIPDVAKTNRDYDSLIEEVFAQRRDNRIGALALLLVLDEFLSASQFDGLRAKLSYRIGVLFNSVNQAEAARERLNQCIRFFEKSISTEDNLSELSDAYSHVATSSRNLRGFAEAISSFKLSRSLAVQASDLSGAAWQRFKLGKMYLNYLEQVSRGMNVILEAKGEFSALKGDDARRGEAACLDEIGNVYREYLGDLESATANYLSAEQIHSERGNMRGVARTLAHRALCEQSANNLAEAEELLRQSIALLETNGPDRRGLGLRKGQLARLFVQRGKINDAEVLLNEAQRHSRAFRDFKSQAMQALTRAEILASRLNYSQAEQEMQRCLDICQKNDLKGLQIECTDRLAQFVNDVRGDYGRVGKLTLEATNQRLASWEMIADGSPTLEEVEDKDSIGEMYKSLFERLRIDYEADLNRVTNAVSKGYELALEERQRRWDESVELFRAGAYGSAVAHDTLNEIHNVCYAISGLMHKSLNREFTNELSVIKESLFESATKLRHAMQSQTKLSSNAKRPMRLPAVLSSVVNEVGEKAGKAGVKIVYNEVSILETYECDPNLLRIISKVIIENAIDAFSDEPDKTIWIEGEPENNQLVELCFNDNGPGIPQDVQDQIFDRGFSTKGSHAGLGLWTARVALNQEGGAISCNSLVNGGTRFSVSLPVNCKDPDE